ncbi:MAG: serine/threonine protein kinase [Micrococcales bacterium]|nr:serine/threonine protein kinase [Micrococcales bacterium]
MRAEVDTLLADGRYRLETKLAVGGMGEVWRARDLKTGVVVAVKVLREEYTGDQVSLKRLRIEARNAGALVHPNIAAVYDYREEDDKGYLVMEYVEGPSLADVLAEENSMPPLRLLPILIQAALGLHAAHSAGVVHRDVKPGNILLGPGDAVKLTDFGISVAHGQITLTDQGKVMGTAQYLAPEQALGHTASPSGDLYALGVVAYEALVGERPFTGSNQVAIALAQVRELPPPLPSWVEPSLAALVMRLLQKDPIGRPADGAELAAKLAEVLETHRKMAGRWLSVKRHQTGPDTGELPVVTSLDAPSGLADPASLVDQGGTASPVVSVSSKKAINPVSPISLPTSRPAEFVLGVDLEPIALDASAESATGDNYGAVLQAAGVLPGGDPASGETNVSPVRTAGVRRPGRPGAEGVKGIESMPRQVSWVTQWLIPALIAVTLLAMIVIGLIVVIGPPANTGSPSGFSHEISQTWDYHSGKISYEVSRLERFS